jgi:hypothetical protein
LLQQAKLTYIAKEWTECLNKMQQGGHKSCFQLPIMIPHFITRLQPFIARQEKIFDYRANMKMKGSFKILGQFTT